MSAAPVQMESPLWFFAAVALALLLAASNFLLLNEHSIFHADSALAVAGLLITGILFALPYFWRNLYWRAALQGLFAFLAIDLIANDLRVAAIAAAAVPLLVIARQRSILLPACVFLVAMLATSLVGLGSTKPFKSVQIQDSKIVSPQPAIVHLILDEHIGIEGLQDPDSDPKATRAQLRNTYTELGFRVYGRAYSEHLHTVNAVPWAMNFGLPATNPSGKGGVRIGQNRYFDTLNAAGYRVQVLQTAFANFCAWPRVASCTTYEQQSLGAAKRYPLATPDRAKLIYFKVLDQSQGLLRASHLIDRAAARLASGQHNVSQSTLKRKSRSNTLAGMAAFDDLIATLEHATPGNAYVAHILLPHTPYIVGADCTPRPFADWEDRDTASPLDVRQRRYLDQVKCSSLKVRKLIASLDRSPSAGNYIVIAHGDHGSRLTKYDPDVPNRGRYDAADLIAGFSTLFAIKAKGVPAGYDPTPASAAALLGQFVEGGLSAAPTPKGSNFTVQLDDADWRPRGKERLPNHWLAH